MVTAGAPIGLTAGALPPGVQVLALENHNDVVPHLDGRTNPDRTNITTVTIDRDDGTIGTDHSVAQSYVPGAADVDASATRRCGRTCPARAASCAAPPSRPTRSRSPASH